MVTSQISPEQYFDLSLTGMKKTSLIKEMNLSPAVEINIPVKDNRSPSAIRRFIREVDDAEQLRPKNCDCSCFTIQPVDAASKASKELSASKIIQPSIDSFKLKPITLAKEISTTATLKVQPKKQATKSIPAPAKKTTTTKKKSSTSHKKQSVYKGRLAKK